MKKNFIKKIIICIISTQVKTWTTSWNNWTNSLCCKPWNMSWSKPFAVDTLFSQHLSHGAQTAMHVWDLTSPFCLFTIIKKPWNWNHLASWDKPGADRKWEKTQNVGTAGCKFQPWAFLEDGLMKACDVKFHHTVVSLNSMPKFGGQYYGLYRCLFFFQCLITVARHHNGKTLS